MTSFSTVLACQANGDILDARSRWGQSHGHGEEADMGAWVAAPALY